MSLQLNQRAGALTDAMADSAATLRIKVRHVGASRLLDLGVEQPGGLEAGRQLAQICMAGLGEVRFVVGDPELSPGPAVMVRTDHPVAACMASQYAGWEVKGENVLCHGIGPDAGGGSAGGIVRFYWARGGCRERRRGTRVE